jgi:4-carboxymuconolactone decarboxylase
MSRLPELDPEKLTPEQRRVYDDIASGPRGSVRGPFLALLNSPQLADCVQKLGQYVRYDCSVPWKLREIAILVTAHHWRAQYEWFAHAKEARAAGIADSIIDAIRQGKRPKFDDPAEEEVYEFCTELYANRRVTDRTFAKVVDRHGPVAAVELAGLLGHYNLIAITLTVFDVPVPGGEKPLAE